MVNKREHDGLGGIEEEERDISNPKLLHLDKKTYYYVWGWQGNRRVLWGAFDTEDMAYEEGYSKLDSDFTVVPLPTRDLQRASRELRARVLSETGNVDETFRHFKHKITKKED